MFHCSKSPLNNYTEILFKIYASQRLIRFQELQEEEPISYKSDLRLTSYHVGSFLSASGK